MTTLWVALGGAIGSVARYHLGDWIQRRSSTEFPWGTLAINVIGSAMLAVLMVVALRTDAVPPVARVALATGVLGGFTTYSTFNYETLALVQRGAWTTALTYVGATLFGCLAASLLAWLGARAMLPG